MSFVCFSTLSLYIVYICDFGVIFERLGRQRLGQRGERYSRTNKRRRSSREGRYVQGTAVYTL